MTKDITAAFPGRRPRRYRITSWRTRIGEVLEHDLEGWVRRYYEGRGRKSPDFFEGAEPSTGNSIILMVFNDGDDRGLPFAFEDYPAAVKAAVQRLHLDINEAIDEDFDEDFDLPRRVDGSSMSGSWGRRPTRYRITLGVGGGGKRIGEVPEPALIDWVAQYYEDRGRKPPAFFDAAEPSTGYSMVLIIFNDDRGDDGGVPFAVDDYPAAVKAAVQRLHEGKVVRVIDLDINKDIDEDVDNTF